MFYLIEESLTPCAFEDTAAAGAPWAAVLSTAEWREIRGRLSMVIDMDMDTAAPLETKAVLNPASLTGTFSIPDRTCLDGPRHAFAFALDESGVALVDDSGWCAQAVAEISRTKKWRCPSLERFLYDLLETVIAPDLALLEATEARMTRMEEAILRGEAETWPREMNGIRGDLTGLRVHYEQLIDLSQELEENENGFFREENLRYFRMFTERVIRLQDRVTGLREYAAQLRDLMQSQLEVKQNHIMTVLPVITAIFSPLTLIAGWYGMNFRYMPELEWRASYPLLIVLSAGIVVACVLWFRRKKWL